MQYHPGINMSRIQSFGGLPALIFVVFIVCAVGRIFNPFEYLLMLVVIEVAALAVVPLVRRLRQRDSREEQRLFGGHFLSQGDIQQASLLEDAKDYAAAANAWRAITASDPSNATAWHRLGSSLLAAKQYDNAVAAETKAAEFPDVRGRALYNVACAHALQRHTVEALDALERAVDAGLGYRWMLEGDADLASIRQSPRFQEILERSEAVAPTLGTSSEPGSAVTRSAHASGAPKRGNAVNIRPSGAGFGIRIPNDPLISTGSTDMGTPGFAFSSMPGKSWLDHILFVVLLLLLLAGLLGLFLSQLPPGYLW